MYDLHSHVLPGIDDGAKDIEMSLAMLKSAKQQGVDVVAATPHCMARSPEEVDAILGKRQQSYENLMSEIKDKSEYPEIILGAEVYLCKDISEYNNLSLLCYQNTNYILLELSNDINASDVSEWTYNIITKGLRPIIAHIDRYKDYVDIMDELSGIDVIYQINASRFLSMSERRVLRNIFKKHDCFFASSDMHNLTSRPCNFAEARKIADKKFPLISEMLFSSAAKSIVENKQFMSLA